jgi:Asp/Glu/hydantoin racemase
MAEAEKKYRFLFIQPFQLSTGGKFADKYHSAELPKEQRLRMNYLNIGHLLEDVEWDFHGGPIASYGDWAVETREEFCHVAAARLPIVREACESGKYNAIVLLGGGEPGFLESREIARKYGIPVTSCAFSQMHIACMLGNKFSVIDFTETHNMFYYDLVVRHRLTDRCASIRNINFYHARPGVEDENTIDKEREKALRGERSEAVERTVNEAVAAIEEDGAEVITFGCSDVFWLQSFLQKRLHDIGWEVPVLEGYSCAIVLAKLFVDLGVDASGLNFPSERPKRWRRKKTF